MRRRMGRPGLLGTMARTAVVAGTANATIGAMNRRGAAAAQSQAAQQAAFESQAQLADLQSQLAQQPTSSAPAAAPAPTAAPVGDDLVAKLSQLADLKAAGVLDDAEFAAAKAQLLG